MTCAGCGTALGPPRRVGRHEACPRCGADLRSCRNCRFSEPGAYNECREPQAERVLDKERSNFCDYFVPAGTSTGTGASGSGDGGGGARGALERLFGSRSTRGLDA